MDNRDTILDRIRKLLALSNSPNEHEAALAADRAQALLTKYKLEMRDVETETKAHGDGVVEKEFPYPKAAASGMTTWASWLLATVAQGAYCRPLLSPRRKVYSLIGKPVDIEVARELFDWLLEQVTRMKGAYVPAGHPTLPETASASERARLSCVLIKARKSYALGCSSRVIERMTDATEARVAESEATRALVVVEQAAVNAFVAKKYPKLKTTKPARVKLSQRAYHDGRRDGDGVRLTNAKRLAHAS